MLRQLIRRRLLFRVCSWLAMLLYLPVSTGVAVPLPGGKDLSRPFPCMYRQCGCNNAEECWRSCCCHTLAERLEWADANDVEPPAFVARSRGQESCEKSQHAQKCSTAKSCCQPKKVTKSCCATREVAHESTASDSVSFVQALKCGGAIAGSWLGISASVVPLCIQWASSMQAVGAVCCIPDDFISPHFAPPSPPPWV